MKDSGIGTPATRAAIIERLIDVGYIERDGRALVVHREGPQRHPPARRAPADLAVADRRLGAPARADRARARSRASVHGATSPSSPSATVASSTTKLKDVRIPRANLGPCPVCGHDIVENRKGFSCWSREDPGCGFVIWKAQGRQDAARRGRPRADRHGPHREARHRLQGPLRPLLPRQAGADADRGGPVARRVRRAVGPRGRQAAGGRGPGRRGRRRGRARPPNPPSRSAPSRTGRFRVPDARRRLPRSAACPAARKLCTAEVQN